METLKILVVDDEPGMRLAAERTLKPYTCHLQEVEEEVGFEVCSCGTGEEALERTASRPPDILILDHKLPGISGLEVLHRISGEHCDFLTVMITAYASLETAVTATKRGAFEFLAKPFTPDELKAAVYKTAKHLILQRRTRKLIREKQALRFQFTSVMAHELKAPLAAVEQYLHILQESLSPREFQAEARMIDRSLSRIQGMRKLIVDLLDLTRVESGQKARSLVDVDLLEIAQAAADLFQPEAERRGIGLRVQGKGPMPMRADRWELEVLLSNLLSNAVKYNRDRGQVDVRIREDGQAVSLSVSDTGIGISAEDRRKLFGEFVRIKNRQTERVPGSGLGLSLCKKIVALYGGTIDLASTPGQGSTFTVSLPKESPGTAKI